MYLSLELTIISSYILAGFTKEAPDSAEASLKYVIYGALSSGLMLYGISIIYGLTGALDIYSINQVLSQGGTGKIALLIAGVLTIAGFGYKISAVPFHFWTPDVYQGASNETAGLIASLPKVGAVAVLARLISLATPGSQTLAVLLTCLAAASMFYGNLVALLQKDLKRLLGFSSIAHAGYALVGFVALDTAGATAALYYIVSYVFMVLACFVVVCRVSRDGTNVALAELAGLHRRSPLLAVTLLVGVFGLAGLPPFAGFMGKLALLKAALAKGHLALVVIAVINTAIAIYYYLALVREACFREGDDRPTLVLDGPTKVLCVLLIVGVLALGLAPNPVLNAISASLANLGLPVPAPALVW